MNDLFKTPEFIPENVKEVFNRFNGDFDYNELERIRKEVNGLGYDFDYSLEAEIYNLHKILNS